MKRFTPQIGLLKLKTFFVFTAAWFVYAPVNAQQPCNAAPELNTVLAKYHYLDIGQGSEVSYDVFELFMKALDADGIYLLKSEYDKLAKYKTTLYNDGVACRFTAEAVAVYKQALLRADSLLAVVAKEPADFKTKDTARYSKNDNPVYSDNAAAQKKRWSRRLRYYMLYTQFSAGDIPATAEAFRKDLTKEEQKLRERLIARERKKIKRMLEPRDGLQREIDLKLLNAFVTRYDPHTEVFSTDALLQFKSALSPEQLTYGVAFEEQEEGAMVVSGLLPGSPAWKSGLIHKGDKLTGLKAKSGQEIDLSDYDEAALNDWLIAEALTERPVTLTLLQTNQQTVTLTLEPEKVKQDNTVNSYILNGEKKVGYINLPSFYSDDENPGALGCANDVAREITKLQEENIDGLILDLRYNGGGSVYEALGLAGIFIDEGPLCISRERNGKPGLLKDLNRGRIYGGPLIILVNGLSASASEILSGALREYNRALIVGGTTYGKGSGQLIVPLDSSVAPKMASLAAVNKVPDYYIKLTTEEFYHLDNRTHQLKGIVPDVKLEEPYFMDDYREANYEFVLPCDSVVKKVTFVPLPALPVSNLRAKSSARTADGSAFAQLKLLNDSIRTLRAAPLPLTPEGFYAYMKQYQQQLLRLGQLLDGAKPAYKADNNAYDKKLPEIDSNWNELNQQFLHDLEKDIYIDEGFRIMLNLITN
jgi:carboxyl-terminal processing protease